MPPRKLTLETLEIKNPHNRSLNSNNNSFIDSPPNALTSTSYSSLHQNSRRAKTNLLSLQEKRIPENDNCSPMILDNDILPHLNVLDRGAFGAYFIFGYKITKRITDLKKKLIQEFYGEIFRKDPNLLHFIGLPLNGSIEDCIYNGKPSSQYLMRHFQGKTLSRFLKEEYYSLDDLISIHTQLMYIIQKIHSKNYFHKDITPNNIIVHEDKNLIFNIKNTLGNEIKSKWKVALIDFDRLQIKKTNNSINDKTRSINNTESSNACMEELSGIECSENVILKGLLYAKNKPMGNSTITDLYNDFKNYINEIRQNQFPIFNLIIK